MSKSIGVVLPDEWVHLIDKHANATQKTRSQVVRAIIKAYLKPDDGKITMGRPKHNTHEAHHE